MKISFKSHQQINHLKSVIVHYTKLVSSHIYVKLSFKHLHGPKRISLKDNEVALILLGKNIEYYIECFYEKHKKLGIKYFIYIDNGSNDNSIYKAMEFKNTIVAKCNANFKNYQSIIRYYSNTLYTTGGWRLCLDADEVFDYPNSHKIKLEELTKQLEKNEYNGVIAQMLDMMPTKKESFSYEDDIANCINYSTDNINKYGYHSQENHLLYFFNKNNNNNINIKLFMGGIRNELFEENCCLTKHPLFKPGKKIIPLAHPHVTTGLNCADFTALIKHYKFSDNYIERDENRVNENSLSHRESHQRVDIFKKKPNVIYQHNYKQSNPTIKKLLDDEFLVIGNKSSLFFGKEIEN